MSGSTDPLAGQREEVNTGQRHTLVWPMETPHDPCPVEVGQVMVLRRCTIEITRTERTKQLGKRHWVALFTRYWKQGDRPLLLKASGSGYTADPDQALGLGEDIFHDPPPNLDVVEEEDRSPEHKNAGEPSEPEAIPHRLVMGTPASTEAYQRFQQELGSERMAEQQAPLEVRLARLREKSGGAQRHVDISNDIRVIEKRIEAAERKLERARAA
jgi:hypothetical protein